MGSGLPPRYQDAEPVATGGFGVVLRARDAELDRLVAIKRLHSSSDPEVTARFVREARRTATLSHPNLIEVLDFGQDTAGAPYLVYEWVDGADLAAQGTLTAPQLRSIGAAIADALHLLHQSGITHRDVKPANVLLRRNNHPLLADLGIAHVADGRTVHTAEGLLLGTPAFMAPELWRGEAAGPQSDQWAWAASLLVTAGGPLPWGTEDPASIVAASRNPSPPALPPGLLGDDEALRSALLRSLQPAPADRYSDMADFASALRSAAAPAPPLAATQKVIPTSPPVVPVSSPPPKTSRRGPLVLAALALALTFALAASLPRSPPPVPPAPTAPEAPRPPPQLAALDTALTKWTEPFGAPPYEPTMVRQVLIEDASLILRWRRLLDAWREVLAVPGGREPFLMAAKDHLYRVLDALLLPRGKTMDTIRAKDLLGSDHETARRYLARTDELYTETREQLTRLLAELRTEDHAGSAMGAALLSRFPGHGPVPHPTAALRQAYARDLSARLDRARGPSDQILLAQGSFYLMDRAFTQEEFPLEIWEALLRSVTRLAQAPLPKRYRDQRVLRMGGLARNVVRGIRMVEGAAESPASLEALTAALEAMKADTPKAAEKRQELAEWIAERLAGDLYVFPPALRVIAERAAAAR